MVLTKNTKVDRARRGRRRVQHKSRAAAVQLNVSRAHVGELDRAKPANRARRQLGHPTHAFVIRVQQRGSSWLQGCHHFGLCLEGVLNAAKFADVRQADLQHNANVGRSHGGESGNVANVARPHFGDEEA